MTTLWRIYCLDSADIGWQEAWSDTALTACPNDAEHKVNENSVQVLASEQAMLNFYIPQTISVTSMVYSIVYRFIYKPERDGRLRRMKGLVYVSDGATSAEFQLYNLTEHEELAHATITNTDENAIVSIMLLETYPVDECILEINVRRTNGVGIVVLEELALYSF